MTTTAARAQRSAFRVAVYTAALVIAATLLAPFVWTALTSLQKVENLMVVPTRISFAEVNLTYYDQLFADRQFRRAVTNSVVVSVAATMVTVVICAMGGYAIGALRMRGKGVLLFIILSAMLAPALAFIIPLFMVLSTLGLIDTYLGLILTFTVFLMPAGIWILRAFFASVPQSILEAARIDGASRWGVFYLIALPLAVPGIVAVGIFSLLDSWNELLVPLVVSVHRRSMLTVYAASFGGMRNLNYGGATAVAVLSAIPTVAIAVFFRRALIRGLTAGATKG